MRSSGDLEKIFQQKMLKILQVFLRFFVEKSFQSLAISHFKHLKLTRFGYISFLLAFFSTSLSYGDVPLTLSLNEAILLAVRQNPNVQSSRLSYVSQKFDLYVQKWAFYPHYSFQSSAST